MRELRRSRQPSRSTNNNTNTRWRSRQPHPGTRIIRYRCCLPALAGFANYRRGRTDETTINSLIESSERDVLGTSCASPFGQLRCSNRQSCRFVEPIFFIFRGFDSRSNQSCKFIMAERAGFEPAKRYNPLTHFPGVLLQPLGHLSVRKTFFTRWRDCSALLGLTPRCAQGQPAAVQIRSRRICRTRQVLKSAYTLSRRAPSTTSDTSPCPSRDASRKVAQNTGPRIAKQAARGDMKLAAHGIYGYIVRCFQQGFRQCSITTTIRAAI